ncbi:MAG: hypothetical protein OEQ53_22765 [Saprospiraceae bacterium]|nr:hypothetical protein [Saprospiraceae bacterium]
MRGFNLFLVFVFISSLVACKSDATDQSGDTQSEEQVEKKYTVTPFSRSAEFPDAQIESMTYQGGSFDFEISGESYQLGVQTPDAGQKMCANSAKGQHIHLILDRDPYSAQYVSEFEYEVEDGTHNLLAFLSRSYHESIKTEGAHVAQRVQVENGSIVSGEELDGPTLFYSRPKGTYIGDDTKKIMVDFYPVNASIGDDYKIKLQVNGEVTLLDKWQPYYIENLPMGDNTIGIALVYPDGTPVPGNQTAILTRISLREDPLPSG